MIEEKLEKICNRSVELSDNIAEIVPMSQKLCNVLTQDMASDAKTKLAVYGLLNSGKSTLLNVLTNHIEHELFKTGDFRVTTSNQVYETESLIYIDTPGLDGSKQDDIAAMTGKDAAQLILFVHRADKELEKIEIDLLKDLEKTWADLSSQAITIVLSCKDRINPEDLEQVKSKILQQCQKHLTYPLDIVAVASTMFIRGKQSEDNKRQALLIEHSNIECLFDMVQSKKSQIDPKLILMRKQLEQLQEMQKTLRQYRNEFEQLRNDADQICFDALSDVYKNLRVLKQWLQPKLKTAPDNIKEIKRLKQELSPYFKNHSHNNR